MLISLNNDDMKECMKEVGINRFGDRHKILQQIQIEKRKNVSTEIIETIDTPDQSIIQESGESIENDCVGDILDGTEEENEEANENESFDDQTNDNSIVECLLCRDSSQRSIVVEFVENLCAIYFVLFLTPGLTMRVIEFTSMVI